MFALLCVLSCVGVVAKGCFRYRYKEQCASIQAQALEQIRHSANQAHSLDKFRSAATQMQVQALQGVDTSATYSQGSKPDPGNACPPAEDQGRIHGDADAKVWWATYHTTKCHAPSLSR